MLSAAITELLAADVLIALACAGGLYIRGLMRQYPLTPVQWLFYAVNYGMVRVLWRARISGPLPVGPNDGAIIVCNHRSPVDPSFIEVATKRVVRWMVAKEYCLHWTMRWFFNMAEAIPVSRGGVDTRATKTAIRYAQEGGLIGLFPEGRINTTPQLLLAGRSGAAMIALRARVPVIPCYISGSPYGGSILGCLLTPAKVELRIGRPIDVSAYYGRQDEREVLEQLTRRFLVEIARLAGQADFEPELAGGNQQADGNSHGG
jgi:1-acyl-sn-glycerol-3-phosphate acyltransferase